VNHPIAESFRQKVLDVVAKIPKGSVMTYKEVAESAGSPRAFRAVGNILNKNRNPKVPCHRVIRSDGQIGGFAWGTPRKKAILAEEGYMSTPGTVLNEDFFNRPVLKVASELLGKYIVRRIGSRTISLKITEVEAYDGPHDKACHAHKGLTARTAPMFGRAGRFYVYLCYGMHWMLNIVTGPKDYPAAILIRAAEDDGISPAKAINGPAILTKALRITKSLNTKPAIPESALWFEDCGIRAQENLGITKPTPRIDKNQIKRSPRIGVDYAGPVWSKKPYRFTLIHEK